MKSIRRRIVWGVATALVVTLAIWLVVEYSPRDFRSITGLKTDEISYIWTIPGEDRRAYGSDSQPEQSQITLLLTEEGAAELERISS